jgi:hypothetical protein
MVVSSDMRAAPSSRKPAVQRALVQFFFHRRFHHSCRQWTRSLVSMAIGGRPPGV